jgi:hypothetical protein
LKSKGLKRKTFSLPYNFITKTKYREKDPIYKFLYNKTKNSQLPTDRRLPTANFFASRVTISITSPVLPSLLGEGPGVGCHCELPTAKSVNKYDILMFDE